MENSGPNWQERARATAISFLDDNATAGEAAAIVSGAFQQLLEGGAPFDRANFFPKIGVPAIARELRDRKLVDWADALEEYCQAAPQSVGVGLAAADILVARALGDFCGKNPGEHSFALVRSFRESLPSRSMDFLPPAERAIKAESERLAALKAMLYQRAEDFSSDPSRVAYISSRDLPHLLEKPSDRPRFVDVWTGPIRYGVIWLNDPDAYELLRRTDMAAYLDLLEDFPFRAAVYELIRVVDGNATISELCALLKQARPVFDGKGDWLKRNQLAFLILNLLGERLLQQVANDGALAPEFAATLSEVIEALTVRPDKVALGYAWFEHLLMSRGGRQRKPSPPSPTSIDAALFAIAEVLSAQLPPHPSPIPWITVQQDVWRNIRIYSLLAIEIHRQPIDRVAIANLIERFMLEDLVSSGVEHLLDGPAGFERMVVSHAFAAIRDPAVWFRDLWNRLFWLRNRARGHRHTGHLQTNVGQVIALWMACGLELLNAGSDSARALWIELESAVRESALTDSFRQYDDACERTLRLLGGVWRKTFPDDPPPGSPGSLDDFIAPWINVSADLGQLAVILRRYDVQPDQLRRAGISGDLLRAIIKDATAGQRPILGKEDIAAIHCLADELDATLCVANGNSVAQNWHKIVYDSL